MVVLDRPNPIGGAVQGNVLEEAHVSAVGRLAVPMRHGMTLGEQARLARSDLKLAGDLVVVPAAGWRRSLTFDQTGLPFIPPSPNLRTIESLFHYPGLCLFEGTNLSVGRGSDAPFEQIGAPWLDTAAVLGALRTAGLPGVRAHGVAFTPRRPGDGKYADTLVAGIRLEVTDRSTYDPPATAVHLLDGDSRAVILASSSGFPGISIAWQAPRRSGPRSRRATDPAGDRPELGAGPAGVPGATEGRCCCTRSDGPSASVIPSGARDLSQPRAADRSLAPLGMTVAPSRLDPGLNCPNRFCRLSFGPELGRGAGCDSSRL